MTLANYTYGYDAASQLTSYQDANSSLTYGYDKTGQLTSAAGTLNGSSYSTSYSYDANGNRTMPGYVTGKGNELTSDGVYNYTYDNEGNTLTQTDIATGSVTYYTWDYRNRLTEEKVTDSHGNVLNDEKFTYDVNDNRIGVSLNGVQQLYTVYDGTNPYMDFNGSGALTERYLTNPLGLNQFYGQVSASGTTQWFLTDNINSIRQVISSSGASLDAITYDPYGNIVSQTSAANAPRFLYAGAAFDPIMGVNEDREREEDPATGKFLSQDPLQLRPDRNPYRYVNNSPIEANDPSGMAQVYRYTFTFDPETTPWTNHWGNETVTHASGSTWAEQTLRVSGREIGLFGWGRVERGSGSATTDISFHAQKGLIQPGIYEVTLRIHVDLSKDRSDRTGDAAFDTKGCEAAGSPVLAVGSFDDKDVASQLVGTTIEKIRIRVSAPVSNQSIATNSISAATDSLGGPATARIQISIVSIKFANASTGRKWMTYKY